nr:hypothetical protein [uncultured Porphyromonas sp.]
MSQLSKSKRVTIANGFAILAAALLMWVFTTRRAQRQSDQLTSAVVKVAVDLSPDGLRVDSLGEMTGRAKKLLELVLPQREYEIVPFATRGDAIEKLKKGEVQLYATTMPLSMANKIEGTTPTEWLYTSSFNLLHKASNTNWEADFTGEEPVTVWVSEEDQAAITIVENLAELNYPSLSIERSELPTMQLATKLSKGEIDYLICDKNLADAIVAVDSTLQSSKGIGFELQQVWLMNAAADSLKVAIDSAIIAKRGSQEWLEIINELENK